MSQFSNHPKIVHLISSVDVGGAQTQLARLLTCLKAESDRHCVVSLIDIGPTGRMIRDMGIPVYSLGMRRSIPSIRALWKLWLFLRRERPHILWTWLYHADLLGLIVGKMAGVPALMWNVRCSALQLRHYPWLTGVVFHVIARLSKIPDAVVVNSDAGRAAHLRAGYRPRRFEVIANGFDLE